MARLLTITLILLSLTAIMFDHRAAMAQEDGSLKSQKPGATRQYVEDPEYGLGEYNPTGGKNVYCYAIFIVFSLVTVFLAFRGNKKG